MSNRYYEWFEKYNGKTIDGMKVSIEVNKDITDGRCTVVFDDGEHRYTAVINTISAYSQDLTRALPTYTKESEVDVDIHTWSRQAKESLSR